MKKSDEKNYLSLTHFFSKALFLGIGISKVLVDAKESAIISILLGTFIGSLILLFLSKLSFNKTNRFRKIVMIILLYFMLIIGLVEFTTLISSIYLIDLKKYFIMFPTLLLIIYMNTKDIGVHIKVSNILFIICLFIFTIAFLALVPKIDYLNLLPLFNISFKNILFTSLEFSLFSVVPNILYGYLDYYNSKKLIKNYLISNLFLTLFIVVTQGILSVELVKLFKYPEYIVLKKISLLDFVNNVENIISFLWIFTIFMYLSMCSKEIYDISYELFNKKYIYPIFLLISMYFISNYCLDNVIFLLFLYDNLWLILLVILVMYILVNIVSLKKKK